MNKKTLSLYCLLSLLVFNSQAQNALDEVVVTASKFPQKLSETGKVLTILTDSLLRQSSTMGLGELLNRQSGIVVVGSNNAFGSNQDVRLRGASAGNTLILIDGIPVYDPSNISNAFDLNAININQVERIEILKGSQSTLYGSDAVAGVINIITRKNTGKQSLWGNVSAGTYKTLNTQIGVGSNWGKWNYTVQLGRLKTRGFSAAAVNPVLSSIQNFDNDGMTQNVSKMQLNAQLTKGLYWKAQLHRTDYEADLDLTAYTDDQDFKAKNTNRQVSTGFEYEYKKGKLYLNYAWNNVKRAYTDDSTHVPVGAFSKYSKGIYEAQANFLEIYSKNTLSEHFDWLVGADLRTQNTDQTYSSVSDWGVYEAPSLEKKDAQTQTQSLFASVFVKNINNFYAEIGGRFNSHSIYGNNATYSLNPSYLFNKQLKGFLNISSGFKAPALFQLFSPYGNKDLQPEKTKSLEVGFSWTAKKQSVRLNVFKRNTENLIVFQAMQIEPYGKYVNESTVENHGFEVESSLQLHKNLNFSLNYTKLAGDELLRVAKNVLNTTLAYQVNKDLFCSIDAHIVGERKDLFFDEMTYKTQMQTLPVYTVVNLYAGYQLPAKTKVFAQINNLNNASYQDIIGYNTQLRNYRLGVSWAF